jgi:hypothetical protein
MLDLKTQSELPREARPQMKATDSSSIRVANEGDDIRLDPAVNREWGT